MDGDNSIQKGRSILSSICVHPRSSAVENAFMKTSAHEKTRAGLRPGFALLRGCGNYCGRLIFCPALRVSALRPGLTLQIFCHWLPLPYFSSAIFQSVSPFLTVYLPPSAPGAEAVTG